MEYIAPRNMTVTSLSGRSVQFVKGEPKYAPHQMHGELIAQGVVPAEEMPAAPVDDGPRAPDTEAERQAAIFEAFKAIALKDNRKEFTASGMPHVAVIEKIVGWDVDSKERDALWAKFSQEGAV